MKRVLALAIFAGALFLGACEKEEPVAPSGPEPEKENTVMQVVPDAWDPCYTHETSKFVYVEAYHVSLYDMTTLNKTVISPDYPSLEFCPASPVWLASGEVAYVRKDEGDNRHHIYTVPATGGQVKSFLAADVDPDSTLAADPTGRYVYYTERATQILCRLDLQTGERREVTHNHVVGYAHFYPCQKPNANSIYFVDRMYPFNTTPHSEYLDEVSSNGQGSPYALLNTDKVFLEGLAASPDDKYVVFAQNEGLYAYEYRTGKKHWLTRAPSNWSYKDRHPSYSPDSRKILFNRNTAIYICDAP